MKTPGFSVTSSVYQKVIGNLAITRLPGSAPDHFRVTVIRGQSAKVDNADDIHGCVAREQNTRRSDPDLLCAGERYGVALVRAPRERDEFSVHRPAEVPNHTRGKVGQLLRRTE